MRKILLLLAFAFVPGCVYAQNADPADLFSWSAALSKSEAERGSTLYADLILIVAPDHFTYRERTSFSLEGPEGISTAPPLFPQPELKKDPTDGKIKEVYTGTVKYRIPITISSNTLLGENNLTVTANYQGCSQTLCYFPQKKTFSLILNVLEGTGIAGEMPEAAATSSLAAESKSIITEMFSKGYLAAFFAVFIAGLLTSFTPCVYPLIPITVSIFGARDTDSKLQGFLLASTYVLGMAVMYSILGFAAARSGAVFGQLMTNPWIMGSIAVLFVALAISMLGAFDIRLPASWQSRLGGVGGKGYTSAFLMGTVGGIIAAPCTGPVLFAILAYVATTGNSFFGFSLLLVFSLGLGTLFLLIGTFSSFISHLPKSGGWMEGIKSVFGIILLAFALYFLKDVITILRTILSYSLLTYSLVLAMAIAGIALGAVHLSYHSGIAAHKARKSLGVLLCVIAFYVGFGSFYAVEAKNVRWIEDLNQGLSQAREEGKPVMVDFFADWCTVCKQIDAVTFSKPKVSDALKRFVTIKVNPDLQPELQEQFDIPGLPLIIFYDSQGNRIPSKRITGFIGPDDFLEHISAIR